MKILCVILVNDEDCLFCLVVHKKVEAASIDVTKKGADTSLNTSSTADNDTTPFKAKRKSTDNSSKELDAVSIIKTHTYYDIFCIYSHMHYVYIL